MSDLYRKLVRSRSELNVQYHRATIKGVIHEYNEGGLKLPHIELTNDSVEKSEFIVSTILGVPCRRIECCKIPDTDDWEVVRGLKSLCMILQFTGDLIDGVIEPLVLTATTNFPELEGFC